MTNTEEITQWRRDIKFKFQQDDVELDLVTTWGIFSPKEIDSGSKLLLDNLENIEENFDCLDLGCGYGILGLYVAKKCPNGQVDLVDRDYIAVEYSKKNAERNKLNNTNVYLSNGLSEVPTDKLFDLIVCNVPAKIGRELTEILLFDAYKHLKPEGKIYIVGIIGLKEFIKRNLNQYFGNYKKVAMNQHYYLASAQKI